MPIGLPSELHLGQAVQLSVDQRKYVLEGGGVARAGLDEQLGD